MEWEDLQKERILLTNKYFSTIDQPQIIYLLNEILQNEDIEAMDINFSRLKKENIGDLEVNSMDIYIPYRAKYQGILQTIKDITLSPKKMLITDLTMDRNESDFLTGSISMKIYGLEGINGEEDDIIYMDITSDGEKSNPFLPFDSYDKSLEGGFTTDVEDGLADFQEDIVVENYNKNLLEDFESGSFYFIPSNQYIKGNVYKSVNSISNKYSIRLEYNMLALEEENRAYIELSHRDIIIKYPPTTIGLWVHSYGYSPITLGIRFKGQAGEIIDVELSKGIHWIGWEYVEVSPPADLSLYPLQMEKIYLELAYNRDDYGVLLFDKIEANYPKEGSKTSQSFISYKVEKDDTLDIISRKFYGTTKKKNIIMKHNEIKSDKDIWEGKILVIPR